jgi:iron complex transport system substrate-binding protein
VSATVFDWEADPERQGIASHHLLTHSAGTSSVKPKQPASSNQGGAESVSAGEGDVKASSLASPPRVISLLPAATEIVAALDVPELLVGITHECDYPADVVRSLPHVTSTPIGVGAPGVIDQQVREAAYSGESLFRLNEQRITELEPTVVLTQALCDVCAINENDVRALSARMNPSPTIVTLSGTTFDGVFHDIKQVAAALNMADAGERLLAQYRARLDAVATTLQQVSTPPPRVIVIEWTDPIYLAGHWVPEVITRAGGVDPLVNAGTHSTVYTIDQIREAAPDVLLIAPCGYDVARAADEAADLLAGEEWQWVRNPGNHTSRVGESVGDRSEGTTVWALDANSLTSRPGPRIVDAVETIAAILYPKLFAPPRASHALRII